MNYYAFHLGDYASATGHLTWNEDMAYRRLLDAYYQRESPFPDDMRQIYRLTRAQEDKQREAIDTILHEFFTLTEDGWRHFRCDEEIKAISGKREKARAAANAGVKAREQKSTELRALRMKEAKSKGTHSQDEWTGIVAACGGACVKCGSVDSVQKDHITPIYQGGSDGIENLQPLCKKCNSSKGPDSTDHRPPEVVNLAQRLISERSANAQFNPANADDNGGERLAPNPNPNPNQEQKNTPPPEKPEQVKTLKAADLINLGVDEQVAKDWLAVRKQKKAPLTPTAMDATKREAEKAGLSIADAVQMAAEQGWAGFKADWVKGVKQNGKPSMHHSFDKIDYMAGVTGENSDGSFSF